MKPGARRVKVVSEQGYGKRSDVIDYRVTNRGGKGVKTLNITEKTGRLVAIKNVTDDNDLMIINQSGIVIRLAVADCRVMGRATQGVRLINLTKKNDVIASVCKVMSSELEASVEEESRSACAKKSEEIENDNVGAMTAEEAAEELFVGRFCIILLRFKELMVKVNIVFLNFLQLACRNSCRCYFQSRHVKLFYK